MADLMYCDWLKHHPNVTLSGCFGLLELKT